MSVINNGKEVTYMNDDNSENGSFKKLNIERMSSSDGSCELQENDLNFIGEHSKLSTEEVKEHFKGLFKLGKVDRITFRKIVEMCYPNVAIQRLENHIFKVFDEQDTGFIEFRSLMLVIYALSNGSPEDNLKQIFKLFDRNSNEEITVDEFRAVVHDIFLLANERKVSVQVENQLVSKIFSERDTNSVGRVIIGEFIRACKQHNYIIIIYIKTFAETYGKK